MSLTAGIPKFPERSLSSKAVLYRPLQDIDIYVEDEGSEIFYTELLRRLVDDSARIATVIPLRGRENVVKKAQAHTGSRPAIFLIDGDLHWVADLPIPSLPNLFVHPCYCVENYLFCEQAMIEIAIENHGAMSHDLAKAGLEWNAIRRTLVSNLVPLFIDFATAFALCPEIKTVSRGIGCILRDTQKGTPASIDVEKVEAARQDVIFQLLKLVDETRYMEVRAKIEERAETITDPLDIVSGKDFLMPVQMFEIARAAGAKVQRRSFIFRLARHCNLEKLAHLRCRIHEIIAPNKAMEATASSSAARCALKKKKIGDTEVAEG